MGFAIVLPPAEIAIDAVGWAPSCILLSQEEETAAISVSSHLGNVECSSSSAQAPPSTVTMMTPRSMALPWPGAGGGPFLSPGSSSPYPLLAS